MNHGEGVPIRVVVGAGLPSLVPFARGGWPFKNAKVPTCAPRGLVGPLVNLLEPTNMFYRLFFCGGSRRPVFEGGGPTRAPRTHTSCAPESRVATSHLVTPAGRCRRCCLEQCLEGGGRKALRPLGHTFLSRLFEQDSKRIFNLALTQPRQPPCAFLRSSLTPAPQVSWSERAVARVIAWVATPRGPRIAWGLATAFAHACKAASGPQPASQHQI